MNDLTADGADRNREEELQQGRAGEERSQRILKMKRLQQAGYSAKASPFQPASGVAELVANFEEDAPARISGRLMIVRQMGKSIFADLRDGSGRIQVYVRKQDLSEQDFEAFSLLDAGDFISVEGVLFITRTGEKTIRINRWALLSKALRPLPEKWHGLKDVETRYRRRYLDLIANPDSRAVFEKRSAAVREIRTFLWDRGFVEVETPMLQPQFGGAAAKPFRTRYESLSADMYLRIAPELYLKRLLVGGFDKVFELNRNFRNEGISRSHNPEFTMLEIYQAYSDLAGMKELIESLITNVAMKVCGSLQAGSEDNPIDLSLPWREASYKELVAEAMGSDWFALSDSEAAQRAAAAGLSVHAGLGHLMITHEVYEKLIEKNLKEPTFVTRLPFELIPLAKTCRDDPSLADVFELVIGGREIAPAYSELNDALEQRDRFEQQAGEETQKVDEEFLEALEHGMPPAGGMGVGIDRLVMILTGQDSIRDVILFPQLKPKD